VAARVEATTPDTTKTEPTHTEVADAFFRPTGRSGRRHLPAQKVRELPDGLLTNGQVAALLDCSTVTVAKAAKSGRIPAPIARYAVGGGGTSGAPPRNVVVWEKAAIEEAAKTFKPKRIGRRVSMLKAREK
jgi:hypothetical protein